MNQNNESGHLAAEAEALMALIDAEVHSDDPAHPDHVPMPSDDEIAAMAKNAFDRASLIVEAQSMFQTHPYSEAVLATVVATWSAQLGLVPSTRKAETAHEGRAWKARVTDRLLASSLLGAAATGPLFVTVTDAPVPDGTAVTVTLPLNGAPVANVMLVAFVDYGTGVRVRIPLHAVDLGAAAERLGLAELSGRSVVSVDVATAASAWSDAAHPIVTLLALDEPS